MIGVVNSIVGGAGIVLLLSAWGTQMAMAVGLGVVVCTILVGLVLAYQRRRFQGPREVRGAPEIGRQ